jgi:hypothetical protein
MQRGADLGEVLCGLGGFHRFAKLQGNPRTGKQAAQDMMPEGGSAPGVGNNAAGPQ